MSHLRCGFRCLNRRTSLCWFCQVDSGHGSSDFTTLSKQQTLFSFRRRRHASPKDELWNPNLSSLFERSKQKHDRFFWAAEKDGNAAGSLTHISSVHRFQVGGYKDFPFLSVQQCYVIFLSFSVFIVGWNIFSFVDLMSFLFFLFSFNSDLLNFYFSNLRRNIHTLPTLNEGAHIAALTIFIPPHQAN